MSNKIYHYKSFFLHSTKALYRNNFISKNFLNKYKNQITLNENAAVNCLKNEKTHIFVYRLLNSRAILLQWCLNPKWSLLYFKLGFRSVWCNFNMCHFNFKNGAIILCLMLRAHHKQQQQTYTICHWIGSVNSFCSNLGNINNVTKISNCSFTFLLLPNLKFRQSPSVSLIVVATFTVALLCYEVLLFFLFCPHTDRVTTFKLTKTSGFVR